MRKIAAIGTALLIGGGLVAGAAPAQAQPLTINCPEIEIVHPDPTDPICPLVNRQLAHVDEEVGYAWDYVSPTVYALYDWADQTVRCTLFDQCT